MEFQALFFSMTDYSWFCISKQILQFFFCLYVKAVLKCQRENVQANYEENYWLCTYRNPFNIWGNGLMIRSGIHSAVHHHPTNNNNKRALGMHFCLRAAES